MRVARLNRGRVGRLVAVALVAGTGAGALSLPAVAHDPGVVVSRVAAGRSVTGSGTAHLPHVPTLGVDAGDSRFVEVGRPLTLTPIVSGATSAVEYRWSGPGKLTVTPTGAVNVDTKGVPAGVHTYSLEAVEKSTGAVGRDSVKAVVVAPVQLLKASKAVNVGLPDEGADSDLPGAPGAVDGATTRHPFTVPGGASRLVVSLDWTNTTNPAQDFDMRVDDPSNREDGNTSASTGAKPEVLDIAAPAAGGWAAIVNPYTTIPDTYTVTASVITPPNLPKITTTGPYTVDAGQPVTLKATPSGGRGPLSVKWDLDLDGVFETNAVEPTQRFALGSTLVAAKVTDADGFETREVTAVRVTAPGGSGSVAPLVVVGVNDTGINPYHDEWSTKTYPDERVLRATNNFTRHPSEYIPGYPKDSKEIPITIGKGYLPKEDQPLWTATNIPLNKLVWIKGTKIIGAIDQSNVAAANSGADVLPIIDEDGHGTASAGVATGNTLGYCPTCLVVFAEGLGANSFYQFPWVDIVSTSGQPLVDTSVLSGPRTLNAKVPSSVTERGQTVLFAAGNGNENGFITPNDTYKNHWAGPDWVIRVGAADSKTRKPIFGDGNPVDVTSFGSGPIPSPGINSTTAIGNHSGTSAATPITAGVFGSVLAAVREQLGDEVTGQRPGGAVAVGRKIAGSKYLSDGVLSRAEFFEAVLKTAEPDTTANFRAFSPQVPFSQFHYVFQGYGVADFASANRAVDVIMGRKPLPITTDVDAFLNADGSLRRELYGPWKGQKPSAKPAAGTASTSSSDPSPRPFAGVTLADVGTLDKSLPLIAARVPGAFRSSSASTSSASASSADASGAPVITSPAGGTSVDTSIMPKLAVTGTAGAGTVARAITGETRRFFPRRDGCTTVAADNLRISLKDGPDAGSGCGIVLQSLAPTGVADFEETYAAADGLPLAIDPGRPIKGTVFVDGSGVSPMHTLQISLLEGARPIGVATVTKSVINVRRGVNGQNVAVNQPTAFDFSFPAAAGTTGRDIKSLVFKISIERSGGLFFHSLDAPASFIDIPVLGPPVASSIIEVSVDDPTFKTPARATVAGDGAWGTNVELGPLAPGRHVLRARSVSAGKTSAVRELTFTVTRTGATGVEVQVVRAGEQPVAGAWVPAAVKPVKGKDVVSWSASVANVPKGRHELVARVVRKGVETARSAPKAFTKR